MPKQILLSINITCPKGRVKHFKRALNSLYYQKADFDKIELLFLNDGGEDELYSVLKSYKGKFRIRYFVVERDSNVARHAAGRRNFLARKSCGKYLLITDPEVMHYSNTIRQVIRAFEKFGEKIWYCGPVYGTKSFVDRHRDLLVDEIDDYKLGLLGKEPSPRKKMDKSFYRNCDQFKPLPSDVFEAQMYCTAISNKYFKKVKGFHENMKVWGHEDVDLFNRLKRFNYKRVYDKNFIVYHLPHKTTLDATHRRAWNLYNSSLPFSNSRNWGLLTNEKVKERSI